MAETKKFCIHSDGLGYCDILSDDETRQYCVEGPCPHEKIVEYAPVRYGRWKNWYPKIAIYEYSFDEKECSECGYVMQNALIIPAYYCPNCGAKMEVDNG